jgi:hypothetical protein
MIELLTMGGTPQYALLQGDNGLGKNHEIIKICNILTQPYKKKQPELKQLNS